MTRLGRLEVGLVLTLGVALLASVGVLLRQSRRLADCQRQLAANQQSIRELQQALRRHELEKPPAEAEEPTPPEGNWAALARRQAAIEQLNRELSEARARITDLEAQLVNSKNERETALASVSQRHQKEQEDWQRQLDALKQELDSVQAESQASRERSAALEGDIAKLRSESNESSAKAAEVKEVVADLRDLDRRRDAYLTSIMRRYRDITSEFRAMSGMLDSSHDLNSSALSSAALTRIQNAISLADDDLRQLSELNAQMRQLEKKLAKK